MNELDTALVADVSLYLTSTREFYERCRTLRLNYSRKVAQGRYRKGLAVKGLLPHVTAYLKRPEFKRLYADLSVPLPERIAITKEVLSGWEDEIFAL